MMAVAWIGWVLAALLLGYTSDRARAAGNATGAAFWGTLTGGAFVVVLFITGAWARA